MITAALTGQLDEVNFSTHEVFGLAMPTECPDVPAEVLSPKNTWSDKAAYDVKANQLAEEFINNFEQFRSHSNDEILGAAPKVSATV